MKAADMTDFRGVPRGVDAAFTHYADGQTYVFVGPHYHTVKEVQEAVGSHNTDIANVFYLFVFLQ